MSQMGGTFVASVPAVPVGSMQAFAGSSAPTGWLLCNGTAVSRTTYSNLYSVIGTTYGVGDGSTTFGLPDMRGRVPMGAGTGNQLNASGSGAITGGTGMTARTAGAFGGEETHLLSSAEIPAHSHPVSDPGHFHGAPGGDNFYTGVSSGGDLFNGGGSQYRFNFGASFANTSSKVTGLTVSNNTGGGGRHAVVPPFVVLNYVIKAIPDTPRGGMTATFTPPIVTSLPLVPQFGDQVVYAADATNGVYWLLQYDATGTYPWKFIGGAPLLGYVASVGQQTTTATWQNLSGPSATIPLAGDYDLAVEAGYNDANSATYLLGIYNGASVLRNSRIYNTAYGGGEAFLTHRVTAVTAATVIRPQYWIGVAQSVGYGWAASTVSATPIRVKAA